MSATADHFGVIVVGAGHAGCEAASAAARMGARTLLLTLSLDRVAQMSCNPAIGGLAKGQVVREIDALGGLMGKVTDQAGMQFRMLNTKKGPAVRAPRAQADRALYSRVMKRALEETPGLTLRQGVVDRVEVDQGRVTGVVCQDGKAYQAGTVVLTTGTFLRGLIHVGSSQYSGGRMGEPEARNLSGCLEGLGFDLGRLKTGTPPRLNGRTIRLGGLQEQPGDPEPRPFSFSTERIVCDQVPCWLTHTNPRTHEIIRANLDRAPLYTGQIRSTGPRYCPSIETKIVRFADKERHQVFLEPEGRETHEVYANGIPTSLPTDVQEAMVHSILGLEAAQIMRYGYAIEYDFVPPRQLWPHLETKRVRGLFCAGQINGTSGYEEAAGQGLMAGINAALKLRGDAPFVLRRDEAYIGVLVDDLVTKGTDEPYRLFTSRAEYRLILRQDNADRRLMPYGHSYGLVDESTRRRLDAKERAIDQTRGWLDATRVQGQPLTQWLRRPEVTWDKLAALCPALRGRRVPVEVAEQVEIEVKYQGYIERQRKQAVRFGDLDRWSVPDAVDYDAISDLSNEARQKLKDVCPQSLGQASRISGVSPADISVLMVHLTGQAGPRRDTHSRGSADPCS